MVVYEVCFRGEDNQHMSIAGVVFHSGTPRYYSTKTLPLPTRKLDKIPRISVVRKEMDKLPEPVAPIRPVAVVGSYNEGVVWTGAVSTKLTEDGAFKRNVPRFDIPPEKRARYGKRSSFRLVTK